MVVDTRRARCRQLKGKKRDISNVALNSSWLLSFSLVHFGLYLLRGESMHQLDGLAGQCDLLIWRVGFAEMNL
jgi:hypothetical protein